MSQNDYTSQFAVEQPPDVVYRTIVAVRDWWTGDITGEAKRVGDVFTYRYEDLHFTRQRVTQLVPDRKVVWHVEDGQIAFVAKKGEWDGTDIVFEIFPKEGGSLVRITHVGLVPAKQCFEACSGGWNHYFGQSLKSAIEANGGPAAAHVATGALADSVAVARAGLAAQGELQSGERR